MFPRTPQSRMPRPFRRLAFSIPTKDFYEHETKKRLYCLVGFECFVAGHFVRYVEPRFWPGEFTARAVHCGNRETARTGAQSISRQNGSDSLRGRPFARADTAGSQ